MSDNNPRSSGWLGPWCLLVGVILLVTGLFFAIGGFKLVSLGGSWYFLIAGVITLLSAIQFFRRKSSAVGLFALVFLGTQKGPWGSARSLLSPWASPLFRCFNPIRPCRLAVKNVRWYR